MVPTLSAAQGGNEALVGAWEGTLDAGAAQLPLVFHITQGEDGSLAATMDSPAQGAFGIGVDSVTVEGVQVSLGIAAIGGGLLLILLFGRRWVLQGRNQEREDGEVVVDEDDEQYADILDDELRETD